MFTCVDTAMLTTSPKLVYHVVSRYPPTILKAAPG